jgi:murein DD-endopeptidase MepM/ murein hydrolase activator NlpD
MDEKQHYQKFVDWSKNQEMSLKELFPSIEKSNIYHIDLSLHNSTVKTETEFNNPAFFEEKLNKIQQENPSKIIAGGYLEKRALYTSDIYNAKNSSEKRNIHLGIDFWLPEKTPIYSLFDGEIVCAVHQKEYKGYGGFIILKHQFKEIGFYTLYGHLSEKSVLKFVVGDKINKNEQIGILGNYAENGEWVPHLHFQIMLNLLDYENDFPGVALESEIGFWKTICPNPNLLFKSKNL